MLPAWHVHPHTVPIPDSILATLALHVCVTVFTTTSAYLLRAVSLQRDVARPLVSQPSIQGGDTGHWGLIEARLESAYSEHGNQRGQAPGWLS